MLARSAILLRMRVVLCFGWRMLLAAAARVQCSSPVQRARATRTSGPALLANATRIPLSWLA